MIKKSKYTSPRYQLIAIDIASKIVDKHYNVGDKIYTRSSIASQYGVSAETARRAISILAELEIVESTKGSGVVIKAYEKAVEFVHQYNDIQTINDLKKDIMGSVERQVKEMDYFNDSLTKLIDKMDRFRSSNPFTPYEIEITTETPLLNKTVSEMNFWHNTSATIIAVKRNDELLRSPGPYITFLPDDIVYYVGDDKSSERVYHFIYPDNI
ncbi:MAG: GntR family transcriptional regulator [Oscillospiraceae bacterium]|nr:GntR family transcriptional regulator [Oscillospiraceae bacterium]